MIGIRINLVRILSARMTSVTHPADIDFVMIDGFMK